MRLFSDLLSFLGRIRRPIAMPISPEALLARSEMDLDTGALAPFYSGQVVLVTGAGGTIGSELAAQLLRLGPRRLVLLDHSEHALFTIGQQLQARAAQHGVPLRLHLGCVTDEALIDRVLSRERPDVILHAAAYKHVPLVEDNPFSGLRVNVIGTQRLARAAARTGVRRFILVSSDKAVRPANVMGASKRLAELVLQDLQNRHPDTRFAIVRFGNVLGSSGSVVPQFQTQIARGGPVTVTDPHATRLFMTRREAAQLLLLAASLGQGGEIFVLNLGAPQRILTLAETMIRLSGHRLGDPQRDRRNIAITLTGLRPGEKLHEALLSDPAALQPTPHPQILQAREAQLSEIEVAAMLRGLGRALAAKDPHALRRTAMHWAALPGAAGNKARPALGRGAQ